MSLQEVPVPQPPLIPQGMSLLDKSPTNKNPVSQLTAQSQYNPPTVRRMRNTAVLVKWIEEHQSNPYPTKAEKQYLAYYSGMNLTQLSTWFANARRRIKKIGMKTWLEGRSTFTVDIFPSVPARPLPHAGTADYGGIYNTGIASNSYNAYTPLNPYGSHQQVASTGLSRVQSLQSTNPYSSDVMTSSSSIQVNYGGLYAATVSRSPMNQAPLLGMGMSSWPTTAASSLFPSSSVASMQARPSSNTGPTLHSPLTAQVYSSETGVLRSQSGLEMGEAGYSSLSQPSPEQMLPECASSEPMIQDSSPKARYNGQN